MLFYHIFLCVCLCADIPHSLTDEALAEKDGLSSGGKSGAKNIQTHTFTNFPDPHESDDGEEDKNNVRCIKCYSWLIIRDLQKAQELRRKYIKKLINQGCIMWEK